MTTLQALLIEMMKLSEEEQQAVLLLLRRSHAPAQAPTYPGPDRPPLPPGVAYRRTQRVPDEQPFRLPEVVCSK